MTGILGVRPKANQWKIGGKAPRLLVGVLDQLGSLATEPHEEWKKPGCLGYLLGILLPGYVGIGINHYKDPYQTTSIMEIKFFFCGSPALYVSQRWRFHVLRPLLRWTCELWEVIWKSASTGHFDSMLYYIGYVWSCCWVSVWYFFLWS